MREKLYCFMHRRYQNCYTAVLLNASDVMVLEMQVRDRGLWLASYKDVPKFRKNAVLPSMFPSGKSYQGLADNDHKVDIGDDSDKGVCENFEGADHVVENSTEEVSDLPLERCMRIVPHDQNTGAFFIALLQKISPLPGILT